MTIYTYTGDQADQVEDNIKAAEFAQIRKTQADAAAITRATEETACLAKTQKLLTGLSFAGVPGTITEIHQGYYSDGTKEPKLYVNEALPSPLPKAP